MRQDPDIIKTLRKGSIVQIDPAAELGFEGAGCFAVVVNRHTWGVDANIVGQEGTRPLSWPAIEPTGGVLVWEKDGTRVKPQEELRHHP